MKTNSILLNHIKRNNELINEEGIFTLNINSDTNEMMNETIENNASSQKFTNYSNLSEIHDLFQFEDLLPSQRRHMAHSLILYTFKPKINNRSIHLASRRNSSQNKTIFDILYEENQLRKKIRQKIYYEGQVKKAEKENIYQKRNSTNFKKNKSKLESSHTSINNSTIISNYDSIKFQYPKENKELERARKTQNSNNWSNLKCLNQSQDINEDFIFKNFFNTINLPDTENLNNEKGIQKSKNQKEIIDRTNNNITEVSNKNKNGANETEQTTIDSQNSNPLSSSKLNTLNKKMKNKNNTISKVNNEQANKTYLKNIIWKQNLNLKLNNLEFTKKGNLYYKYRITLLIIMTIYCKI